jgi:hypothetical protein
MKQGQIPDEIETDPDEDTAKVKQIRRVRAKGRKKAI